MKQIKTITALATGAAFALTLSAAFAQGTTTTVTGGTTGVGVSTSTTGTTGVGVSTTTSASSLDGTGTMVYTPGSDYVNVRTSTTTEPTKYYYSKSTTIVDPEGKTVEWSALRPDMPVRYTYVKEGDRMVISKVTLTKPISTYEKTTTTTTTTKP